MTNTRTTKRALFSSVVALFLCFAMLLGTTYAWFTDSVTSANNIIKSGNLDIELYNGLTTSAPKVTGQTKLFDEIEFWEPGVVAYENLTIANEGNLALKYQLSVNFTDATQNNAGKTLAEVLKVGFVEGGIQSDTREGALAAVQTWLPLASFAQTGKLNATETDTYGIVIYWEPSDKDNDFMNLAITLGVNLLATQATAEEDSFGSDYDDGAFIPVAPEALPEEGESLVINGSAESNVTVSVPATVVAGLDDEVTSLTIAASAPIVDTANKTVTFTTLELQDQNGDKVDLSNSTAKVTVTLPVGNAFANGEQVEVYHDGSFVTYATVANGEISYQVSHFCEVSIKAAEEVVLDNTIDSVKEFIAFAAAVNAGKSYAGETVVLGADLLDLAGVTWTPIGTSANPFKGTFDGNGKVIKNLSVLMAGTSDVGLFGFTTEGEIKNVTVENAKIAGRLDVGVVAGTPYTSKYTNITVKGHVEVDGMAYVGGVAGKNAYANWTNITVDVDANSYVNANSVENGTAYRTYVGGVVGFNGEGGHSFTNITSNINVIGSTCDIGGAFGIAHYGNNFENVTVTGTVTGAEDAFEIGGIAGVWHNQDGTKVTLTNCVYKGELPVVGASYNVGTKGELIVNGEVVAASASTLKTLLATEKTDITLFCDIALNEKITIAKGKTVVLNLNGNTISSTLSGTGNQDLFLVKGNLTVMNGNIYLTATVNQGWGAMSTIFDITDGGVVTLDKVVADNKGGTDMNFVAHLNNWGTATFNVTDSTLKATYVAVRVFNSGYDMNNVTIKNSTLSTSGNAAFWVHNYTVADFGTQEKADAQAKLLNFTLEGNTYVAKKAAFRLGFTNEEYYNADGTKLVATADELKTAIKQKNATIYLAGNTTFEMGQFSVAEGVTIIGDVGTTITGTLTSTMNNVTVKNVTLKSGNAQRWAYAKGSVVFENCTFEATSVYAIHYDGTAGADITYKNCKIIGWVAITGGYNSLTFDGCEIYGNGTYGVIRTYGDATIKNCTFDVADVNTNDVYQDGIHAVDCTITVENCTNANGDVEDLFNVSGTGKIVVE